MSQKIHDFATKVANVILMMTLLLFFVIFGYANFRAYFLAQTSLLTKTYYYYVYIIGALVGIALNFLAFKLPENRKINIVLMGTSIFAMLYVFEFVLFISIGEMVAPATNIPEVRKRLADKAGISFDKRTKFQVLLDLEKQGIFAYPVILPEQFIEPNGIDAGTFHIFPLSGISRKVTVFCNENGQYAIYTSDEHGFNNPDSSFSHAPIDITLIGDSFTHGACVRRGDDIGSVIRQKTAQKVINLGMWGNGPLLELATLKEYAEPLRPKKVIWLYCENDNLNLKYEQHAPLLLRYLDEKNFTQGLIEQQKEIDQVLEVYVKHARAEIAREHRQQPFLTAMKVMKLWHLRNRLGIAPSPVHPETPAASDMFERILGKAQEMTIAWGGELYFVYLPTREMYTGNQRSMRNREEVLAIVRRLHIPIIDIHEVFVHSDDPLSLFPFKWGPHYTVKGYRLVAEKIIAELHLLPNDRKLFIDVTQRKNKTSLVLH